MANRKRNRKRTVLTEETLDEIGASPERIPTKFIPKLAQQVGISESSAHRATNGRFLERKIWNPLAYVADMIKKLRGSGQPYLVNVKIVLIQGVNDIDCQKNSAER